MRLDSHNAWFYFKQPISEPDCQYLDQLGRANPCSPLAPASTWSDVRGALKGSAIRSEAADAVLRPILASYRCSPDESWHHILFFLFWEQLRQVAFCLYRLDSNRNRVDSQVSWAFLQALHRIDLDLRRDRLGQKIINDTQHDARRFYVGDRAHLRRCRRIDDEIDRSIEPDTHGIVLAVKDQGYEAVELRHDRSRVVAKLRAAVQAGRLDSADYLILIGCHVYGRTLDEMADRLGLRYQTAKKRRQRAVKSLNKSAPELSPDLPGTPLEPLRRSPRKEKSHVR